MSIFGDLLDLDFSDLTDIFNSPDVNIGQGGGGGFVEGPLFPDISDLFGGGTGTDITGGFQFPSNLGVPSPQQLGGFQFTDPSTPTNLYSLFSGATQGQAQRPLGSAPSPLQQVPGSGGSFLDTLGNVGTKSLGALPILGVGAGLAGIIQSMMQGAPTTQQTMTRNVQAAGPQEQLLMQQTLAALQQLQGQAANAELQQAVKQLASGQLPISPDLVKQVTNAFGGVAGNLAQGSVENARSRGFQGGLDLLSGAAAPQYSQSMAQLQSDVSQALVNLALGLPTTAANIQSSLVNQQSQPIQLQQNLLNALQNARLGAANQTVTNVGPQPTLLNTIQPFGQLMGGLGGFMAGMRPPQQPIQFNMGPSMSGLPTSSITGA